MGVTPNAQRLPTADRRHIQMVACAFCVFGALWGICQAILADMQRALNMTEGALGFAMTMGVCVSIPAMLVGGRLVDRWGTRWMIAAPACLLSVALCGLFLAQTYLFFCIALGVLYGSSGAYDVAINAAAVEVEQRTKRRVLTYFHAAFSGVAAMAAIGAGLLISHAVPFRVLYLAVALLSGLFAMLVCMNPGLGYSKRNTAPVPGHGSRGSRLFLVPAVVVVSAITTLSFFSEGVLQSWSGIYLRSSLGLSPLLGAAGPSGVYAAMAIGRALSGYVVARFGPRALLGISGMLAAAGVGAAVGSTHPVVVLLGFLVCGLAQSSIAPVAYSVAGDVAPARAGEVTSIVTTISYSGFLIGPALIGQLADSFGLRLALSTLILAGFLISVLSLFLKPSARDRERSEMLYDVP